MVLEVEREGYTIGHDPARVVNLPMLPQSGVTPEQIEAGAADNLVDDYLRQIDVNAPAIVEALRLISDPANRPGRRPLHGGQGPHRDRHRDAPRHPRRRP